MEDYHKLALARCEESGLGNFFSKVNVFHAVSLALYGLARFIIAPVIYGSLKLLSALTIGSLRQFSRLISPVTYDVNDPVDRINKRFAELKNALTVFGHFPQDSEEELDDQIISEAAQKAEKRSVFTQAGLSLFSEARKVLALGHTPTERTIGELEDKFNEYVRASKRARKTADPYRFFREDVSLGRDKKFSYDFMVQRVKSGFPDRRDQQAVDQVAEFLKADLMHELEQPGLPKKIA